MAATENSPLASVLQWLAVHAGFPARRLAAGAELMLCVAALAAAEERATATNAGVQRNDAAQASALRTHALRRSQVHYKCDNSAKV